MKHMGYKLVNQGVFFHSIRHRSLERTINMIRTSLNTRWQCIIEIVRLYNCVQSITTARKQSLGQGNVFTPVCRSVHRGEGVSVRGVSLEETPPERDLPKQRPPWTETLHPLCGKERAARILMECILLWNVFAIFS